MVVSGAPVKENDHADRVCDMALDMVEAITDLKDRSTGRIVTKHCCYSFLYFRHFSRARLLHFESYFSEFGEV